MSKHLQVQRHELKYYINRADYQYCKFFLKHLMDQDPYQKKEEGYFIRSLYLDDMYDNSVEEKLSGIEKRDKYRLRIYDVEQGWVKLERKRKDNDYVLKTTALITKNEALNIMKGNYQDLLKYNNQNFNSIYFDLKRKYFRPVVIVDYIRDAFILDYNRIRITFDKHLRSSVWDLDLFSPNIMTTPYQKDEVIIMEVKFNNALPLWFSDFFRFKSATKSAISKYCQSRIRINQY